MTNGDMVTRFQATTTGLSLPVGVSNILPQSLTRRIEQWFESRSTGQIALNFHMGRILSYDMREHNTIPGHCSRCMAERKSDDRGWTIVRGQALCEKCSSA